MSYAVMLPLEVRAAASDQHALAVETWARRIAEELGLSLEHVERIGIAARLADVGKLHVPRSILTKPGPLTSSEWAIVRRHPEYAARLLRDAQFEDIRPWILFHHERPDGRGYPYGLTADDIPLEAAIIAVADGWAAMTADRPHRRAMRQHKAAEELRAGSGRQWDDRCVTALLRLHERALGVLRPLEPDDVRLRPHGAARAPRAASAE